MIFDEESRVFVFYLALLCYRGEEHEPLDSMMNLASCLESTMDSGREAGTSRKYALAL